MTADGNSGFKDGRIVMFDVYTKPGCRLSIPAKPSRRCEPAGGRPHHILNRGLGVSRICNDARFGCRGHNGGHNAARVEAMHTNLGIVSMMKPS
jgi:hypothetical protein